MNKLFFLRVVVSALISINFYSRVQAQVGTEAIQIPPVVQMQLQNYQDRFQQILSEECPSHLCSLVGCEVIQFLTLDEQQDASLPGLETPKEGIGSPQYKLSSVRCELAHESSLLNEAINSLMQRLLAKGKLAGTSLQVIFKKLPVKAEIFSGLTLAEKKDKTFDPMTEKTPPPVLLTPLQKLGPWMGFAVLLTLLMLLLIWGFRTLGKQKIIIDQEGTKKSELDGGTSKPEPSASMILTRIRQINERFKGQPELGLSLKPLIQNSDLKGLCQVLRHFGAEALSVFSENPEFKETLLNLRKAYQDYTEVESNSEIWLFLDKIERLLVAAEVGPSELSLNEEFSFLQTLGADEFFHLLQMIPESDLPLILSFAPAHLQNDFYQHLDSNQLSQLMSQITQAKSLPDKIVREKALSLRQTYVQNQNQVKRVSINQVALIEKLMNSMNHQARRQFLKNMALNDVSLVQQLAPKLFIDECLTVIPTELLNETFLKLQPEQAAIYLDSLPFKDKIQSRLNPSLVQAMNRWNQANTLFDSKIDLNLTSSNGTTFIETDARQSQSEIIEIVRRELAMNIKGASIKGQVDIDKINQSLLQASL